MTLAHETSYPRINADLTPQEMERVYSPTRKELEFVEHVAKRSTARLGVLLHLKIFQRLGHFIPIKDIPDNILAYIAGRAGYTRKVPRKQIDQYDTSGSKREHLADIRRYLNVKPVNAAARAWLREQAIALCQTKHLVPELIDALCETLVLHRYELPGFSTIDDIASQVREEVHDGYLTEIAQAMSAQAKTRIDRLLIVVDGNTTAWQGLKRDPRRPTNKAVRAYLHHLAELKDIADLLPKIKMPQSKMRFFRSYAQSLDASELKDHTQRYALAAIFIVAQRAKALDDAADVFGKLVQNLENGANEKLIAHRIEQSEQYDELAQHFYDMLDAYTIDGTADQRLDAMGDSIENDPETWKERCQAHLAYAGRNFVPFMRPLYAPQRPILINCIEIMQLKSTSEDTTLAKLVNLVLEQRNQRSEFIDLGRSDLSIERDLAWLDKLWRKHVVVQTKSDGVQVHRRFLELAVLCAVKRELKSGDLCVPDSARHGDFRLELADDATFASHKDAYAEAAGISADGDETVRVLREKLTKRSLDVDERFPENASARLVDDRLVLTRYVAPPTPAEVERLDQLISERLVPVTIVDVLIDTMRWLKLHHKFRPLSGTHSQVKDHFERVVALLLCYGCNLGPTQTSRSLRNFSRKQIAWLNIKWVDEQALNRAIKETINAFEKFALPTYWGDGKAASADGTKWTLGEQNITSEYHIRYGGFGGIGYYHVSNKYIALLSRFITCSSHESIYIFDVLYENESDIQPTRLHGDTQAQTVPAFALSYIIGVQLMPRIRHIGKLVLYAPDKKTKYKNIAQLFEKGPAKQSVINWDLIKKHYNDILRVAVSLKLGLISPSTILRRLGTYSQKNKLYEAVYELGKVIRTLFLLDVIDDPALRKTIHTETNKSEQYNGFVKWCFFGGESAITENLQHELQKIMKYSQLVANLVILYNVDQMTRIVAELIEEGEHITPEMLRATSPYRRMHINKHGTYTMDLARKHTRMEYGAAIARKIPLQAAA